MEGGRSGSGGRRGSGGREEGQVKQVTTSLPYSVTAEQRSSSRAKEQQLSKGAAAEQRSSSRAKEQPQPSKGAATAEQRSSHSRAKEQQPSKGAAAQPQRAKEQASSKHVQGLSGPIGGGGSKADAARSKRVGE